MVQWKPEGSAGVTDFARHSMLTFGQFLDLSENLIETLKLGRDAWPWFMEWRGPLSSWLQAPSDFCYSPRCLSLLGKGVQSRHETPFFLLYR